MMLLLCYRHNKPLSLHLHSPLWQVEIWIHILMKELAISYTNELDLKVNPCERKQNFFHVTGVCTVFKKNTPPFPLAALYVILFLSVRPSGLAWFSLGAGKFYFMWTDHHSWFSESKPISLPHNVRDDCPSRSFAHLHLYLPLFAIQSFTKYLSQQCN